MFYVAHLYITFSRYCMCACLPVFCLFVSLFLFFFFLQADVLRGAEPAVPGGIVTARVCVALFFSFALFRACFAFACVVLGLPYVVLRCLALPCRVLPCLALPCLSLFRLASVDVGSV